MKRLLLPAVFLLSAATLMNELLLIRIFSVTMWYHFAFLTICLALLGMSMAGTVVYVGASFFKKERLELQLTRISLLHAILLLAAIFVYLHWPNGTAPATQTMSAKPLQTPWIFLPVFLFLPSFFVGGFIVTLLFTHRPALVSRIYFADLSGAAAGCLATIGLLHLVTGPEAVVIAAGVILLATIFLAASCNERAVLAIALPLFLLCLATPSLNQKFDLLHIRYTKSYTEDAVRYERWNPISRLTVFDRAYWNIDQTGFGWGKERGDPKYHPNEMWIEQDASAGTPMTQYDGNPSHYGYLAYDVTFAGYSLRKFDSSFIIGPGGGRDILAALYFRVPKIVAAELNPNMMDIVNHVYGGFTGHIYSQPGVEARIGDARTVVQHSKETFDFLQISLIDSWAATLAGAFALAENNLYTLEAFQSYVNHLTPDGILSVSRWYPYETMRLIVLAIRTLESQGVKNPLSHIVVLRGGLVSTLLLKHSPFTAEEVNQLRNLAKMNGFSLLLLGVPRPMADPAFESFMQLDNLDRFIADYPLDLSVSTDDRPFFFNMDRHVNAVSAYLPVSAGSYRMLVNLLITVCGLVVGFILLPLLFSTARGRSFRDTLAIFGDNTGSILFFAALGVSYLMVEVSLVQRFILFLGHPVYAASVVLFSMLLASGLGSFVTQRTTDSVKAVRSLSLSLFLTIVTLGLFLAFLKPLLSSVQGVPLPGKIAVSGALLGLLGFLMGMPFPLGLKIMNFSGRGEVIPWMWAINGACSVLASVGAIVCAIRLGYSYCLAIGIVGYLLALLASIRFFRAYVEKNSELGAKVTSGEVNEITEKLAQA